MDMIFAQLTRAVGDSSLQVDKLTIDTTYGYPRMWRIDDVRNGWGHVYVSDQASGGSVALFNADAHAWSCSWWGRLRKRCS